MPFLGLNFDSTICGVTTGHDPVLVGVSFVIASIASYTALDMSERMRRSNERAKRFWMLLAGLALGGGIWSMHFIAMIALEVPLEQGYEPGKTILSGALAVVATIAGLSFANQTRGRTGLALGGAIIGVGVVGMHYLGMSALQVPGLVYYRPGLFFLSILIALAAAVVAIWLAFKLDRTIHRLIAAGVMAVAICGMHYTGMMGTVIVAAPVKMPDFLVHKEALAAIVAFASLSLMLTGLVLAHFDRKFTNAAVQEAERLRILNAELEEAKQRAEAAAIAKSEFLANMSHEIRTPLNGVLGMAAVLQERPLGPDELALVQTIRESGTSLMRILNDILDFSKIDAGHLDISPIAANLRKLLTHTRSLHLAQAEKKGIRLDLDLPEDLPETFLIDTTRVQQCVSNLIANAIKFTSAGGVTVTVGHAPLAGSTALLSITVSDSGVGIDEAGCARIFSAFTQADGSISRQFGGTGLGLAISRKLARLMGGDIVVQSKPNEGSAFTFTFCADIVQAAPAANAVATDQPIQAACLEGVRVLVTDDNAINRRVVSLYLASIQAQIVEAENGQIALDLLAGGQSFDLILLDIQMPILDGVETIRRIRTSSEVWAEIPAIALTANAMTGDREHYLDLGMTGYLSKPLNKELLLAEMQRVLGVTNEKSAAA